MTAPDITLLAERPVSGGLTLGRHDGMVVLMSGAIPGERVRARVDRATRQVIFASTVEVLDPSPHRRVPFCDPACGGLALAHVAYEHQLTLKAAVLADTFQRLGKIVLPGPVPVAPSPETGYRLRARLHLSGRRWGFFREGSHTLCDAAPTGQLSAAAAAAAGALVDWLGASAAACEAMTLSENVAGTARAAHLESRPGHRVAPSVPGLPDGITGVTITRRHRLETLAGVPQVYDSAESLCGAGVDLPPAVGWHRTAASFFQGNRALTGPMLLRVLAQATGENVVDLYAGVGLFAVALAARGAHVIAVEGDPVSGADLDDNARPWPTLDVRRVAVEAGVADLGGRSQDAVVLDPPRTGMSPQALAEVLRLRAQKVVYVSCYPATLARDARALLAGGYRLGSIEAFDLFPNTPHIETLCVFDYEG